MRVLACQRAPVTRMYAANREKLTLSQKLGNALDHYYSIYNLLRTYPNR